MTEISEVDKLKIQIMDMSMQQHKMGNEIESIEHEKRALINKVNEMSGLVSIGVPRVGEYKLPA